MRSLPLILMPQPVRFLNAARVLTELLKQDQYSPLAMEQQVCVIYAGTKGYLDKIPVGDVRRYEAQLLQTLDTKGADILKSIRDTGKLDDDVEGKAQSPAR